MINLTTKTQIRKKNRQNNYKMRRSSSRSTRKTTTKRRRLSTSDVSKIPCDGKVGFPSPNRSKEELFSPPLPDSIKSKVDEIMSKNNKTKDLHGQKKQGLPDSVIGVDLGIVEDHINSTMQKLSKKVRFGKSSKNDVYVELLEIKSKLGSLTKAIVRLTAEVESLKSEMQKHQ